MYISDIFKNKSAALSFEVFPPKKDSAFDSVQSAVNALAKENIDYMSVTYGAGGSTTKNTAAVADHIQNDLGVTALAHLTCVSSTKDEIRSILDDLRVRGIKNILALRGDLPQDVSFPTPRQYKYACELVREIANYGGFCIGGACYPEGHPDCASIDKDIENLKAKVDAGCSFLVTQLFFDNDLFYEFRNKLVQKGIDVPVTAGIMPLTSAGQIDKMCVLSGGAAMPGKFTRMFAKYRENPIALKQAGITYAIDQITDLLSSGADGIHIYTMNKPDVAEKITASVKHLF